MPDTPEGQESFDAIVAEILARRGDRDSESVTLLNYMLGNAK